MFLGYLALGDEEMCNSTRQWTYAQHFGLKWLSNCGECELLDYLLPSEQETIFKPLSGTGTGIYVSATADPAPWVIAAPPAPQAATNLTPDLAEFCGISLLSMTGVHESTRTVSMISAITGGAVGARTSWSHREMVATMLLVGADQASLTAGLEYVAWQRTRDALCGGETLYYFNACPCMCTDPPFDVDCLDLCVAPYLRQMNNVRVTSGPNLLTVNNKLACGSISQIEMTLTAGDPYIYGVSTIIPEPTAVFETTDGYIFNDSPDPEILPQFDPFRPDKAPKVVRPRQKMEIPTEWRRSRFPLGFMSVQEPQIVSLSIEAMEPVRKGVRLLLLDENEILGSWYVRSMPGRSSVDIHTWGQPVEVEYEGRRSKRSDVVIGGDGSIPRWVSPRQFKRPEVIIDVADEARVRASAKVLAVLT